MKLVLEVMAYSHSENRSIIQTKLYNNVTERLRL